MSPSHLHIIMATTRSVPVLCGSAHALKLPREWNVLREPPVQPVLQNKAFRLLFGHLRHFSAVSGDCLDPSLPSALSLTEKNTQLIWHTLESTQESSAVDFPCFSVKDSSHWSRTFFPALFDHLPAPEDCRAFSECSLVPLQRPGWRPERTNLADNPMLDSTGR